MENIGEFMDLCYRKKGNQKTELNENEKKSIQKNVENYFLDVNQYFKNRKSVTERGVQYLIPISRILSSKDLNNVNIQEFATNYSRGFFGIVKVNPEESNKVNKYMHLKIRNSNHPSNMKKNINLKKIFGQMEIEEKDYKKMHKTLLTRNINYIPARIFIEYFIQNTCYQVLPDGIPQIYEILFYRKIVKIKMARVNGYEFADLLDMETSNEKKTEEFMKWKQYAIQNFGKIIVSLSKNVEKLQKKLYFVHGDFHDKNILIQKDIFSSNGKMNTKKGIQILDFDLSSIVIPMEENGEKKWKWVKNYNDRNSFFEYNKYLNPLVNPHLSKITDFIRLFTTILFGNSPVIQETKNGFISPRTNLNSVILNEIIQKLGIENGFQERHDVCLKYFRSMLQKNGMHTSGNENGKQIFFYYYHFLFMFVNFNYQLRNYILFNKILVNKNQYKDFGNEKLGNELFLEIMNEKSGNFIQPSFEEDTLGERFTCQYLQKVFS